ncbi:type II toxin-antitoxin system VapC family toxin [Burkholderia ubonensis]|uniref:type II toxin-antitoxin system VapC family toxin n=1 Tax=Burkholderia ubonensis TaxID=101571 RepID=UPI0009B338BD|nr:type II toxin-antitoxin system VapC family toxin [Burkholderia ubonensis]
MVYVETSVLVALCVNEPVSPAVSQWYAACTEEMVSAAWCVTEFASALGIKQRTKQLSAEQGASVWQAFERLCAGDLQLFPVEPTTFHRAAVLTLDASTGLCAGDALHLAAALDAKAKTMATLDDVLARISRPLWRSDTSSTYRDEILE